MSPIHFDESSDSKGRKGTREIYHPPRDQYSQKVSNGSFTEFESTPPQRGRGGRRGWGNRRGRGRGGWVRGKRGGGSWKV